MHNTICSHCSTANPAEAQFCIECGSSTGIATGATVKLPSKRCASCGGEAPPLANFCPLCGRTYEAAGSAADAAGAAKAQESTARPAAQPDPPRQARPQTAPAACGASINWGWVALAAALFLFVISRGRVLFFVAPLMLGLAGMKLSTGAFRRGRKGMGVGLVVFFLGLALLLLTGNPGGLLFVALIALASGWLASQVR